MCLTLVLLLFLPFTSLDSFTSCIFPPPPTCALPFSLPVYFSSHSLLGHSIFKDAASLGERVVQAPALGLGSPFCVVLWSVSPASRGVEAERVLQGETKSRLHSDLSRTLCLLLLWFLSHIAQSHPGLKTDAVFGS